MRNGLIGLLASAGAGLCLAGGAQASDLSFFNSYTNADVASFGIGYMRNVGTGELMVSGLSGTVSNAFLYWHGPMDSSDPLANAAVTFGGVPIVGTGLGFTSDNNWGMLNSQAYRADVTSIVSPLGNGSYALSDFLKNDADINGASLIVFFDDGNAANNQDVFLFEGNDSNASNPFDADGWNAALDGLPYAGGPAELVLHVADGQDYNDANLVLNGVTIAPATDVFAGDGVQFGDGSYPANGALWDIESYDVSGVLAANNLLTTGVRSDNLSLIVAQINLPSSAVPEPASWLTMIAGFGLLGGHMRRRKAALRTA